MSSTRPPLADEVFTLADLDRFDSSTTWLAVLGHPIKHSMSPAMHNAALAEMARTEAAYSSWRYVRFDVPPESLPIALREFHARRFRGLNLTVPHKVLAVSEIKSIEPSAQLAGAVNTLRWSAGGWEGFNTDGYGLARALKTDLGADLAGANVILLGAGGAARGAAVECLQRSCASLWIANRTREKRDELLALLRPLAGRCALHGFDPQEPPADLPCGAWLINATSAGLQANDAPPIDLARLPAPAGVFDMIYNPPQTDLLKTAAKRGVPGANGLSMLVHQGARALEIWTERSVPVAAMENAVKNAR